MGRAETTRTGGRGWPSWRTGYRITGASTSTPPLALSPPLLLYTVPCRSIINVDCLLDAVQALVADCDHPAIRKIKNIDAFVNRCKNTVLF